jgi:transcription termination factor Rho
MTEPTTLIVPQSSPAAVPSPRLEAAAPAASGAPDAVAPAPLPTRLDLNDLQRAPLERLAELAVQLGVKNTPPRARHPLVCELVRASLARQIPVTAEGVLEMGTEPFGFLRWPDFNFLHCPEDLYVPAALVRQHGLRGGHRVSGTLRPARDKEKFTAIDRVSAIEGIPVERWTAPKHFDLLTPQFPTQRIILESPGWNTPSVRTIDLIATLGRGQRGLILAPPRAGKTVLLKHIAKAIRAGSPDIHLMLLLVDERPEEVTDFKADLPGADIFSSTFDEASTRHAQVAEMVGERARRLVELGEHVVILLDSITRLSRGYNAATAGKGRLMSGGLESKALTKPKKFFSAARNVEEGGSLTILATALVDTGSKMDEVIFEEFKGTGNMELHLDRELLEKRIFPAIHILKSGTRREELLYHPDEMARVQILRKQLGALPPLEGMEVLLEHIHATKSNMELLLAGVKT